jgi:hypothetical protein
VKHPSAVFSREETSPDGSLQVCYNYSEGERTPTIIEPCVTVVATGEVLFDFWGTRLNGHVHEFTPTGFNLTVSDNYEIAQVMVHVDAKAKTFTTVNDPTPSRPLSAMADSLSLILDRMKKQRAKNTASQPERAASFVTRLRRWFS